MSQIEGKFFISLFLIQSDGDRNLLCPILIAREVGQYLLLQIGAVDVCIDFRRTNTLVAQHRLDGTQIRSTLEHVCGKGVTKRMRADVFRNAGALYIHLDVVKDCDARQMLLAPVTQKDIILLARLDIHLTPFLQPNFQQFDHPFTHRHQTLL